MSKKAIARINQMSREEWLALRMHGLGGSDAAAACGMSKWKSPLMLWLEKTGKQASQAAGEAAYWGTIMEPILRNEFAKRTGLKVEEVPFMFQSQEYSGTLVKTKIDKFLNVSGSRHCSIEQQCREVALCWRDVPDG